MVDLYAIGFDPVLRTQDFANWLPDRNAPDVVEKVVKERVHSSRAGPIQRLLTWGMFRDKSPLEIVTLLAKRVEKEPKITNFRPQFGGDMYRAYCASCHGVDGQGKGPSAYTLKSTPTDLTKMRDADGKFLAVKVRTILSEAGTSVGRFIDLQIALKTGSVSRRVTRDGHRPYRLKRRYL